MKQYIALLRGVNVGGKNKIAMPSLKKAFEDAGFSEVATYINSGNVIFSCPGAEEEALQQKCRRAIAEEFGLDIAVSVISEQDFSAAMKHMPEWWGDDEAAKHNAIFVIAPARADELVEEAGAVKPEHEKIAHYGPVIFWSAPIETFSKTRWSKIVGSAAYGKITIRNANTAKKLLQLMKK